MDIHFALEMSGIAIGLGALAIGWCSFRFSERAQTPVESSGLPWDLGADIRAQANRTRAAATARTLYAVAALLSAGAITIGVANAHVDSPLVFTGAGAMAVCLLIAALMITLHHRLALRVSHAREAFDRFYVGTGLCKYEAFELALARFACENRKMYRIAHRSLRADHAAAAAAHERQMAAYVTALGRALA